MVTSPTDGRKARTMKLRWSLLLTVVLLFLCSAPADAQNDKHLSKRNALGLKIGYHFYLTNDMMDYWLMEEEDYNSAVGELTYEFKLSNYVGIDFSFCFFETDNDYGNSKRISGTGYYIDMYPSSNLKVRSFFLSPSIKAYLPLNESVLLYAGVGPDYNYTQADFYWRCDVNDGATTYQLGIRESDEYHSFGYHGLAGIEYYFYKEPQVHGAYDAPVSLFLEYKYSSLEVKDVDDKVLNTIRTNTGVNVDPHDMTTGGHFVYLGLRWHF
jgi:opacity protein-like surface antigen